MSFASASMGSSHPEEYASIVSKFLVLWITPLINLANERKLDAKDIPSTPKNKNVDHDSEVVRQSWMMELETAKKQKRKPDFSRALFLGFLNQIINGGIFQFAFLLTQLAQPLLVGELVNYVATGEGGIKSGIAWAIALGVVAIISSSSITMALFSMRRLGAAVRSGVMMHVFTHAINLTSASKLQNSVGQTTNLIAIDAEKLFLAFQFLHFLWHGPIASICVCLLIMRDIGFQAALAGLGWIFVLIPLQNYIAGAIGVARRDMIKFTDGRVKLTNESLQSIRTIKLHAWEAPLEQRILGERDAEMKKLGWYLLLSSFLRELLFSAGPITSMIIFTTYIYGMKKEINIVQVFRVLAYVNTLRFPLNLLGQSLKNYNDGKVSVTRITNFLLLDTVLKKINTKTSNGAETCIKFSDATYSWVKQSKGDKVSTGFTLKNINLTFKSNELIAVVGSVGSGKSTLISSILGETVLIDGEPCKVEGSIAYCNQTPWIQNLSLRQNVLFGADYEAAGIASAYDAALDAAALRPDIAILPDGDLTEIGERGINLSGGQKARVSIARAFLASLKRSIVLLDDPWSAVDGNTGNLIFEEGIMKLLKNKLRIIALNSHLHLLEKFDRVIILHDGCIIADGSLQELRRTHHDLVAKVTGVDDKTDKNRCESKKSKASDTQVQSKDKKDKIASNSPATTAKKLIATEKRGVGAVPITTYARYFASAFDFRNISSTPFYEAASSPAVKTNEDNLFASGIKKHFVGFLYGVGLIIVFGISQVARIACDYYLASWSRDFGSRSSIWSHAFYISQGVLMGTLWMRSSYLNRGAIAAASTIHRIVLRVVLSAPITTFFDTHTIGEVLNRFAKDTEIVDSSVPEFMLQVLINWFQVLSVFALCIWTSPWFLLVMFPIFYGFMHIYYNFSAVSSDLKRLESVSRSPIYASLSEVLTGLDTIRAYDDTPRFLLAHRNRMEYNMKFYFHLWMCMSWVTARLEITTSTILVVIALLAVGLRGTVSPISLGLALSYGLQLTALFQRCVQVTIDVATYMTSTERIFEYYTIDAEKSTVGDIIDGVKVNNAVSADVNDIEIKGVEMNSQPVKEADSSLVSADISCADTWVRNTKLQNWPSHGKIEFRDVYMQYRDNPPVLKGITFAVKEGERVGICGRTGSGKSSILMTLFRIVPLLKGNILIDNNDITMVPLQILRRRIAIIPQDPVIFSGTIRFQLDPFNEFTDEKIWGALSEVSMKDYVESLPLKLDEILYERGENLSQGQRQLLCIARALLRKSKIIVIDEGTSAVDPHTDNIIQEVLKSNTDNNKATILTVAHRLSTIVDYDRVLVLRDGVVAEFDTPNNLIADKNSLFYSMLQENRD